MNRYEQELLNNCSNLDAVTNAGGKITNCAQAIIDNKKEASKRLCRFIEKSVELKNSQITSIAIATKDSLIKFYGYSEVVNICSSKENDNKDDSITLDELMSQLNQLVGLASVKSKVNDLIAFQKVQLLRKEKGMHSPKSTMHLAFTGNPGTGKTTVARIVGRIYKKLGLLSKGHFMEVSRTDLIAGYQGQTAHKVKEVIDKAKGGVLFIDEAYSITENDHSDSYGRECLTELTKALEDYREDLVVIVAGYTEPMKQFFESNPGLKSRFNTFIEFDDYKVSELIDILKSISEAEDYVISERVLSFLSCQLTQVINCKDNSFANGRYIRNIFETMIMNHARRVVKIESPSTGDLKMIKIEDVPEILVKF